MQVGKKAIVPEKWQLGDKKINNTTSYKYLGEMITSDNKNKINLEMKENKIQKNSKTDNHNGFIRCHARNRNKCHSNALRNKHHTKTHKQS